MKKTKIVESLESSSLLKTIRPVKNMNYLTEKLPKPNYLPVRYRSFKEYGARNGHEVKILGGSMQDLPKAISLFLRSKPQMSSQDLSMSSSPKKLQSQRISNPEWLPSLPSVKRKKRLYQPLS
jgi:hypothetical protein